MPIRLLSALLLVAVAAPSPALAIDPAYLGYWAPDAQSCTHHDAFRITPEAHREGGGWFLLLRCASEGSDSTVRLHWRLGPDGRLLETQDGQTRALVRCGKL